MITIYGDTIPNSVYYSYIDGLTGRFFKILPLKEENCQTLPIYIQKFQAELIGSQKLIVSLNEDENFMRLIAILQYLIDTDCEVSQVKVEVFEALDICKKLQRNNLNDGDANELY